MSVTKTAVANVERFDRCPYPLGHLARLLSFRIAHQHQDFFTTEAEGFAGAAYLAQNTVTDCAQTLVALDMTVDIVEELEPVDIEHDHRHRGRGVFAAPYPLPDPRQRMTVEEAGQLVALGFALQLRVQQAAAQLMEEIQPPAPA